MKGREFFLIVIEICYIYIDRYRYRHIYYYKHLIFLKVFTTRILLKKSINIIDLYIRNTVRLPKPVMGKLS